MHSKTIKWDYELLMRFMRKGVNYVHIRAYYFLLEILMISSIQAFLRKQHKANINIMVLIICMELNYHSKHSCNMAV